MQETQDRRVPSLGREDPLEEKMATRSNLLGKSRGQRSLSPWGHGELDMTG